MNTTKIGWIGLGNMGIPMSQQLINAGYPVTVYNRSKVKEAALKAMGAAVASTPNESAYFFILLTLSVEGFTVWESIMKFGSFLYLS